MKDKFIKLSYQIKSTDFVNTYSTNNISNSLGNIYDIVDSFEKKVILNKLKFNLEKVKNKIPLNNIINFHNKEGIKNIQQIKNMIKQIESGKDILHPSGLPNIKLVKTKKNELVLFDGHHSILAYMFSKKKYLHELPHLIIENSENFITNDEILIFFGKHSSKLIGCDWRNYVINWQMPINKQLCMKDQKNIGELFNSINLFE